MQEASDASNADEDQPQPTMLRPLHRGFHPRSIVAPQAASDAP
jgi:hypothetical protein